MDCEYNTMVCAALITALKEDRFMIAVANVSNTYT